MICKNCGITLDKSAKFCQNCGQPQGVERASSVMWETCQIGYAEVSSGFFSGKVIYQATATGPKGTYTAAKSDPFKGVWNEIHRCWFPGLGGSSESHAALEHVMQHLSKDGWELVDRGIPHYQYRYRRIVRL